LFLAGAFFCNKSNDIIVSFTGKLNLIKYSMIQKDLEYGEK